MGVPIPWPWPVAEVESHFDMDAVGAAGEVGIMQLNPGPENTYWINLEAETELDPTTPSGNIAAGCYLLGKYMQEYGDANKGGYGVQHGSERSGKCLGGGYHLHRLLHRRGGSHGSGGRSQ